MAAEQRWAGRAARLRRGASLAAQRVALRLAPTDGAPLPGERYFCQNAGSCGSEYIVALLRANGHRGCHHERWPDLDEIGIDHYEGQADTARLRGLLRQSRREVWFEANNRLFAMSDLLREVFPEAHFIHLHRDPRELIPSALSKPAWLTFDSGRRRYRSTALCGPLDAPVLERACHYWSRYNQRIRDDLSGTGHLSLSFADLVAGRIDSLQAFLGCKLDTRRIAPVNADKPVRQDGRYPPFEDWPAAQRDTLLSICGPMMEALGYR